MTCSSTRWLVVGLTIALPLELWAQNKPGRGLSLEEALKLAQPVSEAVAIAKTGADRAHGQFLQARSGRFPQLAASINYTRQLKSQFEGAFNGQSDSDGPTSCDTFVPNPNGTVDERLAALEQSLSCTSALNPFASFSKLPFGQKNTYTFGLSASQALFSGGRIGGQVKTARAVEASAVLGITSAEAQLVLEVVQAYFDAALSDRLVAIAEATLAQTDTTLSQTKIRFEVGSVPEFDLLRATVARDNQRPVAIQARNQQVLAHTRLRQLLGLSVDEPLVLTTNLADTALVSTPTLAALMATAPDTIPEHRNPVRQAEEGVRAQEGVNAVRRSGRLPAVALTSQYSQFAYPSSLFPSSNDFVQDWRISLGVDIPIFTGGRLKGSRVEGAAGLAEAKLRHRQALKAAQLDSRDATAQLEAAIAVWQASEGTATQAARAYQIAEVRYQEGVSTQTELLDARIALQQAEINRARAARDLQGARIRLALIVNLPFPGATTPTTTTGTPSGRPDSTAAATGGLIF